MLLGAAALAMQTKNSLRLSMVEPEVAQVEQLVVAEFTKAAAKADAAAAQSLVWPDQFPDDLTEAAAPPCQPTRQWIPGRAYPRYCTQALARQSVNSVAPFYYQVRMRVRYQASAGAEITTKYGWVIMRKLSTDPVPKFWRTYYLHDWCVKQFPTGATNPTCVPEG
jgi:hypothetical protein